MLSLVYFIIFDELSLVFTALWTYIFSRFRKSSKVLVDFLNEVLVDSIDHDVEILLKARYIHECDQSHPKHALDMCAENKFIMKCMKLFQMT